MRSHRVVALLGTVFTLLALAPTALAGSPDEALRRALDDERKSEAIYQAVIAKLGEVRPFSRIVLAEARHQRHLLALFERYGVEVPANPWTPDSIEVPATRAEACAMAAKAETANVGLYDELLEGFDQADIQATFTLLSDASELRHLPAFERCADGGPAHGGPAHGGQGRTAQTRPGLPGAGAGGCCGACAGGH